MNGDRYEGDFKSDRREGNGKYFFSDGHIYDGEWLKDQENGFGKLEINSGKSKNRKNNQKVTSTEGTG